MAGYLQNLYQSLDFSALFDGLRRAAAVLLCLSVHETCHGLAALALGDPTAKERDRLSLNPLHHIDWLGLAMMFFAGFGWAKPVPVDPRYFKNPKWGMALTSLAGPASNFLLAVFSMLLARGLVSLEAVVPDGAVDLLYAFTLFLAADVTILSLGLGVFNLIPIPPLDGSKVLAAFLPERAWLVWMRFERYGMILLLAVVLLGWEGNFVSRAVYWLYSLLVGGFFS
ncbi:MAG: site-2 protease family protein [Oscillibacter sp.]|nr:site-2 protease family protein [Oscillibacter sp.]